MTARILTEGSAEKRAADASPGTPWRALGVTGAALVVIGFLQSAVYLYPSDFSSLEWLFGAASHVLASLPLPSIGLVAVAAAAGVLGCRRGLVWLGALLLALALIVAGTLLLFGLLVPVAVSSTPPSGQVMLRQGIARAMIYGVGFDVVYMVAGVACLKMARLMRDGAGK